MNDNSWGECVLNPISYGADGLRNGLETTNILTESDGFLVSENKDLLITETTFNAGGFGAMYDNSWAGKTLLER